MDLASGYHISLRSFWSLSAYWSALEARHVIQAQQQRLSLPVRNPASSAQAKLMA